MSDKNYHDGDDHGIGNVNEVLAALGITEHTSEDCRISHILSSAYSQPVLVEDRMVWLFGPDNRIVRAEISSGDRRRLLAGNVGDVTLHQSRH